MALPQFVMIQAVGTYHQYPRVEYLVSLDYLWVCDDTISICIITIHNHDVNLGRGQSAVPAFLRAWSFFVFFGPPNLRVLEFTHSPELLTLDTSGEIRITLYLLFTAGDASNG